MKEWLNIISAVDLAVDWSQIILFGLVLFWLYKVKPVWLGSIRSVIAVILAVSFCIGVFVKEIPSDKLAMLKELTLMAITFYYALKKRTEENGGGK